MISERLINLRNINRTSVRSKACLGNAAQRHAPKRTTHDHECPGPRCWGLLRCRGALFGMAIEVVFESTTPLLHLLGCLKIAGRSKGRLYFLAGVHEEGSASK